MSGKIPSCRWWRNKQSGNLIIGSVPTGTQVRRTENRLYQRTRETRLLVRQRASGVGLSHSSVESYRKIKGAKGSGYLIILIHYNYSERKKEDSEHIWYHQKEYQSHSNR